jgi:U3 small nucleolar RNA-associated protein 18
MATAVADDIVRDEEPHEVQFADFVDEEEEFAGFDEDDVRQSDKDSTEEELERLVFGDSARFRAELKKARQVATIEGQWEREDEEQEGETGLESAQDADVRLYLSRRHVDD